MFQQGLVLLVAGMGLVVTFLSLLVGIMMVSAKVIPRFNHVLPDEQPKVKVRRPEKAPHADSHDAEIAVAIAAAVARQRQP